MNRPWPPGRLYRTIQVVKMSKPTLEQFHAYQAAWDYFNRKLFGGGLRPCLLVFREGKSKTGTVLGHFAAGRWSKGKQVCHEISLNPESLTRPIEDALSTLVHEMVHQWQEDHGRAPRACYHNRQWAEKMIEVGLIPSDTGAPGGKQTGQTMDHYVDPKGPFCKAVNSMPASVGLPWRTGALAKTTKEPAPNRNKVKYTCPGCEANVWGKPGLQVLCGGCDEQFEEG